MVDSCRWSSACLCVLWSYNKRWSNGIIISYNHIYPLYTLPHGTPTWDNFRGAETRNNMNPVGEFTGGYGFYETGKHRYTENPQICPGHFHQFRELEIARMGNDETVAVFYESATSWFPSDMILLSCVQIHRFLFKFSIHLVHLVPFFALADPAT